MSEQAVAVRDESLPYLLFDRADDDAVVAKLRGQTIQAYVYCFEGQDGKPVYGLGVDGAEACKREMAVRGEVIEEEQVHLEREDEEAGYFTAKASRWIVNRDGVRIKLDSAIGTKRQGKFTKRGAPNLFWFEQGCAKAIRNAILRLTPEETKVKVIELYKEHAKTVGLEPNDRDPLDAEPNEEGQRVPFGRDKGKLVAELTDKGNIEWLAGAIKESIEDKKKARFKAKNERLHAALTARLAELNAPPVSPPHTKEDGTDAPNPGAGGASETPVQYWKRNILEAKALDDLKTLWKNFAKDGGRFHDFTDAEQKELGAAKERRKKELAP